MFHFWAGHGAPIDHMVMVSFHSSIQEYNGKTKSSNSLDMPSPNGHPKISQILFLFWKSLVSTLCDSKCNSQNCMYRTLIKPPSHPRAPSRYIVIAKGFSCIFPVHISRPKSQIFFFGAPFDFRFPMRLTYYSSDTRQGGNESEDPIITSRSAKNTMGAVQLDGGAFEFKSAGQPIIIFTNLESRDPREAPGNDIYYIR